MKTARTVLTGRWTALLGAALFGASLLVAPQPVSANCLSGDAIRSVVSSGAAISLRQAWAVVSSQVPGRLLDASLCQAGGGYQYRMTVMGTDGVLRQVTADGRSGRVLSVR